MDFLELGLQLSYQSIRACTFKQSTRFCR